MRVIAFCATLLLFSLITATPAQSFELGDKIGVSAFCSTEEDAKHLGAVVTLENDAGYFRVMNDPSVECYDKRLGSALLVVGVTLSERIFSIVREDGIAFQFWRAEDETGVSGYVWTPLESVKPDFET